MLAGGGSSATLWTRSYGDCRRSTRRAVRDGGRRAAYGGSVRDDTLVHRDRGHADRDAALDRSLRRVPDPQGRVLRAADVRDRGGIACGGGV